MISLFFCKKGNFLKEKYLIYMGETKIQKPERTVWNLKKDLF